jgi:hypothetical protein
VTVANDIEQLTLEISQRQREIFRLRAACQHDYGPSDPTWLSASSPECKLCGDRRSGSMNRIGRRTAVCMIALVLVAIVVSLLR